MDPVIGFIQPGSTQFKDSTILVPKLADPPFWWKSNSTPSKSGSGLTDLDFVLCKFVCYTKYSYLETRSRHVNTSFIILTVKLSLRTRALVPSAIGAEYLLWYLRRSAGANVVKLFTAAIHDFS